jgi:hypothetical protein
MASRAPRLTVAPGPPPPPPTPPTPTAVATLLATPDEAHMRPGSPPPHRPAAPPKTPRAASNHGLFACRANPGADLSGRGRRLSSLSYNIVAVPPNTDYGSEPRLPFSQPYSPPPPPPPPPHHHHHHHHHHHPP